MNKTPDLPFRRAFGRQDIAALRVGVVGVGQQTLDTLAAESLALLRTGRGVERDFGRQAFMLLAQAGAHHPDRART